MAAIQTLHVEAGATFFRMYTYTDVDGNAVDLTGYTALMHIRETADSTLVLSVTPVIDGTKGSITISIPAATTSTLTAGSYVYAIELTSPDTVTVARLLEGKLLVTPEVVHG